MNEKSFRTNYAGSRTMTRSPKIKKMKKSTENFQ